MATARAELARTVLRHPVHWVAFGLGTGLAPVAPGTAGSALGVLLFTLASGVPRPVLAAGLGVAFFAGAWICGASSRRLGGGDHPGIVLDEIVAMMAVLLVVPPRPAWWLAAFALFRLFDIAKPWPIREVDHRLRNGLGIMLDDALAAAYAAVILLGLGELADVVSP